LEPAPPARRTNSAIVLLHRPETNHNDADWVWRFTPGTRHEPTRADRCRPLRTPAHTAIPRRVGALALARETAPAPTDVGAGCEAMRWVGGSKALCPAKRTNILGHPDRASVQSPFGPGPQRPDPNSSGVLTGKGYSPRHGTPWGWKGNRPAVRRGFRTTSPDRQTPTDSTFATLRRRGFTWQLPTHTDNPSRLALQRASRQGVHPCSASCLARARAFEASLSACLAPDRTVVAARTLRDPARATTVAVGSKRAPPADADNADEGLRPLKEGTLNEQP
jgi:hypothetical protein